MATSCTQAKLPPGPSGPAVAQSVRYYRDPYGFLRACHRKYGDWFTVKQIPCGTIVYIADPEAVRMIFADPGNHLVGPIGEFMSPILGHGLLQLDGEAHARERRWLTPSLAKERVRPLSNEIELLADEEVGTWKVGEPFSLRPRFEALTLRVILRFVFGASAASRLAELGPMLIQLKSRDIAKSVLAALPFGIGKWRLAGETARQAEAIDRCIFTELAARRAGAVESEGMVAALLTTQPGDASPAFDKKIRDHIMTLIYAAQETVAATLAWTFERILRHPAVLAELSTGDESYSEAVLLETMRVRPALGDVARELASPLEVGMHCLPVGTRVCPSIVLLHMRPDVFPRPELFRPERFLDAAVASKPMPWMYLPFGGGVRHCLGAPFAMIEMQTILRAILERVELRAPSDADERGVGNGVTIGPHKGALVVIDRRRC